MNTKPKFTSCRFTYRVVLAMSLFCACTLTPDINPSSLPRLARLVQQYAPGTQHIQTLDMGQGKQEGGAFVLKLKLKSPEDFKTKDSESGKLAKIDTDILKFRVFLYQFGGPGPVTFGVLSAGNISGLSTLNKNLTFVSPGVHEQAFLIKNVPAGNYYVGIAAFDNNVTFNSSTNIGDITSNYSYSEGPCFLTNGGGDGGSNPGRMTVGGPPNYTVTNNSQLSVNLNLQDNIGAKLDTRVNLVGGTLFFAANSAGDDEIFSVDVDGLPETNLTNQSSSSQIGPQIRPSLFDKILYMSDQNGDYAIFSMSLTGGTPTQLTFPSGGDTDEEPDWRSDGNAFTFTRRLAANSFNGEIYTRPFPFGGSTAVFPSVTTNEHSPDWSPSANRIVLISDYDGGGEDIWDVIDDGTGSPPTTNTIKLRNIPSGNTQNPLYSPDGSKILFSSDNDAVNSLFGDLEVFVMDDDGTNEIRLTNDAADDEQAVWSPDGSKIAWVRAGNIWVMNNDGTNQTQLTISGDNASPAWTSDGLQIIYKNGPGTNNSVYMATVDGKAKRRISSLFGNPMVNEISFLAP